VKVESADSVLCAASDYRLLILWVNRGFTDRTKDIFFLM
jgi:hypothetical protein